MKVDLARYSGFCMGVRRALALCMKTVKEGNTPLYTLGPLIHNNTVTSELESYGIKTLKDTKDVPEKSFVLIRTHGVSPSVRGELMSKCSRIIDATCPKVARVQGIIRKNVADGFFIVIIGDHDHAETKGLLGYAEPKGTILSTEKDIENFIRDNPSSLKLCVVAQTTQDVSVFEQICLRLRKHFSELRQINTICDATKNRQEEVSIKAAEADSTLVVGGKHSANTSRLFEIARGLCKNTWHIERADELKEKMLGSASNVFITAGASTPLWIIHEIAERINKGSILNGLLRSLSSPAFSILSVLFSLIASYLISESTKDYSYFIVILLSSLAMNTGLRYMHLEKLDVFRFSYRNGLKYFGIGMFFLLMLAIIYTQAAYFLILYYGILFYVVYKTIILRQLLYSLCNLVFWLLPLLMI